MEDNTDRLERLEKAMRSIEMEWSDVYGKFRRLQMRVAKQVQRVEAAEDAEHQVPTEEEVNVVPSADGIAGLTLSPRAAKIQQQILERRNRLQKGAPE